MPRPREPPVFFIDHCLGTEKVAQRLRALGVDALTRGSVDALSSAKRSTRLARVPSSSRRRGWVVTQSLRRSGSRSHRCFGSGRRGRDPSSRP